MQSYFYAVIFDTNYTESQTWAFSDDFFELLETAGFNAGGGQDGSVLEIAADIDSDSDMSGTIEELIRSLCGKHPCVAEWRRRPSCWEDENP